jgi:hypothetical protein
VQNATGGTITTTGDYTVHTFLSSGTFTPDATWKRAYDLSTSNTTVKMINGTTTSAGAFVFDGTDDYITTSLVWTAGQALTVSGWFYSTASTAAYRNAFDSVSVSPMIWWNTSGRIEIDGSYTSSAVFRNVWVHVTLSKPSGSVAPTYYINGVQDGTGPAYAVTAVTPTWFNRSAAQTWMGSATGILVYNRALSAIEVRQNFDATRGRFGI